ncbi:MAG: hybrid sensor histidine kinase/response regulator [Leptolyngbyaceae bacterium]|nr:hybrid sensor histidine kinase/response regulator [Leptolyngbyaceae bacterium]
MDLPASILIVDDEPDNFDVLEGLLYSEGYQLSYASNGLKALQSLGDAKPDLILLDVMMPDLDGIAACQCIKSNPEWQQIPIIMVTALHDKKDLARCLEAGADDFLSKPVNGIELRARVRSLLRVKYQYDQLQAALQLREDMANMIVHDLRNPLTSIILACAILQRMDLQAEQNQKVGEILLAGNQLKALIDSLLMMAKLEAGKMLLNRTQVDLHAIGTAVMSDFERIADQKRITLTSILPEPGQKVYADETIFRRILDNLMSNAIKFSPSRTQVKLCIQSLPDEHVRVQVIDSGQGVSEELRQVIFERFEVGNLFKGVTQTGLGLAFCKLAVEAHEGKVSIEPNQPKGSVFIVEI